MKMRRHPATTRGRKLTTAALLTAAALAAWNPRPASAVNIVMTYDSGSTSNPAGDSSATQLQALMTFIESYYQDIFEDSYTLTLTYYYAPSSAFTQGSTIADHQLSSQGGSPNRETAGTIRVDNSVSWFYDATPGDNSEFTMTQTLWRDLSGTQQGNLYNGTAPNLFESGFTGTGNAGQAASRSDLLSVLLHEVGHALGLSSANNSTVSQTNDGDYDFNPAFVNGSTLAAATAGSNNIPHLFGTGSNTLMQPGIGAGVRRLPSHTDLFAMASASQFSNVDVPRKEFYAGLSWNDASNWSGNRVPDAGDDVNVRPGGILSLNGAAVAANLRIDENTWISSGTSKLDVSGATTIAGGARFRAQTSGEIETVDLTLTGAGSMLQMQGGIADVDGTLTIGSGTSIEGDGAVQVLVKLVNNGSIRAGNNGTLAFTSPTAGVWGFNGFNATLEAVNGNLSFTSTADGDLNTTITVGSGRWIAFSSPWALGTGGSLNLNGSPSPATVDGTGTLTVKGVVNITGAAVFEAPSAFASSCYVPIGAGRSLTLSAPATFSGGTIYDAGTLVQNSGITVAANTTFDVATFDWGNSTQSNIKSLTVTSSTFTINSTGTGTAGNPFRGNMFLNSGILSVNLPGGWSLPASTASPTFTPAGTLTMTDNGTNPTINGTPVSIGGSLTVNGGTANINADVTFGSLVNVTVNNGSILNLNGAASFSGGFIGGLGKINQGGNITIAASTIIAATTFDWGNSGVLAGETHTLAVNSGQTLTVNSTTTSNTNNEFRGVMQLNSGSLVVSNFAWAIPSSTGFPLLQPSGVLNLNNTGGGAPNVSGQLLTLAGGTINTTGAASISAPITFSGGSVNVPTISDSLNLIGLTTFTGGSFTGLGSLRMSGNATIVTDTTIDVATLDLDGTAEGSAVHTVNAGRTWTINAAAGTEFTPGDGFDGQIFVNSATLAVNAPAPWLMQGTLHLDKTTSSTPILSGSALGLSGTLTTSGGAFLLAPLHNAGSGIVSVPSGVSITVFNGFSSNIGAVMTKAGAGSLAISGPQNHPAGARVLVSGGQFVLGSDAGTATSATLEVIVSTGAAAQFNSTQHLANLQINTGSEALQGGGNSLLLVKNLSILGTGELDLASNDMVLDYTGATQLPAVLALLISGRNGGAWNGAGINSSAAANDAQQIRTLGYAEASALGVTTFSGQNVDTTAVLVKYTYYGDSNLNGKIDFDDYALIDKGLALGLTGWVYGDYNLSGSVNAADYMLIDKAFGLQTGVLSPDFLAARQAQFGADYVRSLVASVPEPTAMATFAIAAGSTLTSRRRRYA